jgi:hypothetical protein
MEEGLQLPIATQLPLLLVALHGCVAAKQARGHKVAVKVGTLAALTNILKKKCTGSGSGRSVLLHCVSTLAVLAHSNSVIICSHSRTTDDGEVEETKELGLVEAGGHTLVRLLARSVKLHSGYNSGGTNAAHTAPRIVAASVAALVGMAAHTAGSAGGGQFTCRARQLMLRMSTAVDGKRKKQVLTKAEIGNAKLNKEDVVVVKETKVVVLDLLTELLVRRGERGGERGLHETPHDLAQQQLGALAMLLAFTPDIDALAAAPRAGVIDIGTKGCVGERAGTAAKAKAAYRARQLALEEEKAEAEAEAEAVAEEIKSMGRADAKAAAKAREKARTKAKVKRVKEGAKEAKVRLLQEQHAPYSGRMGGAGGGGTAPRAPALSVHPLLRTKAGGAGRAFVRALVSASARWSIPAQPYIASALWQLCVSDASGRVRGWAASSGGAQVLMRWVQSVVAYSRDQHIGRVKCAAQFRRLSSKLALDARSNGNGGNGNGGNGNGGNGNGGNDHWVQRAMLMERGAWATLLGPVVGAVGALLVSRRVKAAVAAERKELKSDSATTISVSGLLIDSIDSLDMVSGLLIDSIDSLDLVRLQMQHLHQIYTITNCCLATFCAWILTTIIYPLDPDHQLVHNTKNEIFKSLKEDLSIDVDSLLAVGYKVQHELMDYLEHAVFRPAILGICGGEDKMPVMVEKRVIRFSSFLWEEVKRDLDRQTRLALDKKLGKEAAIQREHEMLTSPDKAPADWQQAGCYTRFRAWFLYHGWPYDKNTWTKLYDPWWLFFNAILCQVRSHN